MSSAATSEAERPTLVIGLGNPILGDDGVAWRVIEALEERLAMDGSLRRDCGPVELDRVAVGGLSLMERLVGCDRAILVDAILGEAAPGTVTVGPLVAAACRRTSHLDSAHDAPLVEAMSAGRALGARLPDDVSVIGVAVNRVDVFDERLSPPVEAAVGPAVDAVLAMLARRPVAVA